jgi:hypothetical protein
MSFVSRISAKCNEIKSFIENNIFISLLFFVVSAVVGTLISSGVEAAIKKIDPSLDDTLQIIENQNKQFDEVKNNLSKLQSSLSGGNSEIFAELKDSYQEAFKSSQLIAANYEAVKAENSVLRKVLKKEKGLDGGYDILVREGDGYRIDSAASVGVNAVYTGANRAILSLTSRKQEENISKQVVNVGERLNYTNEKGKQCSVVNVGVMRIEGQQKDLVKLVTQCAA